MGIFDSFFTKEGREVQLKAGDPGLEQFHIGDPCDLPDGVYHALDGDVVVIYRGVVQDVGDEKECAFHRLPHFNKWGYAMDLDDEEESHDR